ncbi:MAG: hypothetical protein AB8H79_00365 [Myxococcota bacterium]
MTLTVRDALLAHRRASGLTDDGNLHKRVDWLYVGPVPLPIPNPAWRKRVVVYHDVSHLLTGYGTDLSGELDEGCFECGAGIGFFTPAWMFNLQALMGAMVLRPRKGLQAFLRGRAAKSVYRCDIEALLEVPLDEARADMLETPNETPDFGDSVALLANLMVGTVLSFAPVAAVAAGIGAAWWALA